jgi:hypothetical protein
MNSMPRPASPPRSPGVRREPCAGDANALRALGLLSRWNRAVRLQAMFAGPCGCCAGDVQTAHLERQVVDHLYERHRSNAVLEVLLRACKESSSEERGAVGEMMRRVASERSVANAIEHGRLLGDFDELVQSLE